MPADVGPVLAVVAGGSYTCAVPADGRVVCFGNNKFGQCDVPADLGLQFWQSLRELGIPVQCEQMVGWSALDAMRMDSVMCQQTWDQFWQSLRALCIPVQFKPKVSLFASKTATLVNVKFPNTGKTMSMFNLRMFSGLGFRVSVFNLKGLSGG